MPQPPLGASIWQALAAAGHPVGTLMRQLGAGLLAPNSASEVDSLMSTIGKIVGEGPPGVNLGMMPMGPGGFRLPPLPRGIPMKTAINLLHPDLQLPHMTGTPEEGLQRVIPTWSGDVKGAAEHVMRPAGGNAGLSTPGAWKPVPGVQQNLGLNTESLPVDNPSPRKASTLSPSPSQPRPITPLDPTKVAPNSPEVTQRLHDGYLATWRNLSVSPPLQQLFERSLQRFIQDASAKGASHDIAELNGAKRALESIMRLKNPPPEPPIFGPNRPGW